MFSKWMLQLLIICKVFIAPSSQEGQKCDSIFDYINGVKWSSTVDKSLSKPICLNKNKEFSYRECTEGKWSPAPICYSLQQETLQQCPYGFTDVGNLCYQLTTNTTFPPRCPFKNNVPFFYYKDLVTNEVFGALWVPAKRRSLSFMEWIEASWLYRQEVTHYNFTKPLKEKQCLVYFKETYTAVSCNSNFIGVCAYKKLDQLSHNLCDSEFQCCQSDFDLSSKCFCQDSKVLPSYVPAEFVKPYQYNIYKKLTNDTCTIGLIKHSSGKYVWQNSEKVINYAYWSSAANFSDRNIYGAGTTDGWILTEDPAACIIFQSDILTLVPSLSLEFDEENDRFIVTVVNPQALRRLTPVNILSCFTNAHNLHLIYSYPTIEIIRDFGTYTVYSFNPLQNASGYHWCEAFEHVNSRIIKTDSYFLRPTTFLEFVGIFQIFYDNEINPLSSEIFTLLQNLIFNHTNMSYVQAIRLMDIIGLDEDLQQVTVNVHFTSTEEIDAEDAEYHYRLLQAVLEENLRDCEEIKMNDFRSSDFCSSQTSNSLTWPKVPIGSTVSSSEFCFTVNTTQVTRTCEGNFTSGAQWSPPEACQIFETSAITERLLQVSNNSSESIHEVYQISLDYLHFTSLDVYLTGKMYSEYSSIDNISLAGETISNFLKINKSELMEGQSKLGATDKFLYFLDRINFKYEWTYDLSYQHFFLISLRSRDLSGLIVVKENDQFVLTKLTGNYSLENITQIDNLVSAIWLSPEYRKDVWSYERITFTVYFSAAFFSQKDNVDTSIIFGMMRPRYSEYAYGPIYVLHRSRHHHTDNYCSFWGYSLTNRGSWKYFKKATSYPPFVRCDYWHFANYAIITLDKDSGNGNNHNNVTNDLIDLLQSNDSVPETMQRLSQISENFCQFSPVDLDFVGQILERVSDNDYVDFSYLAKTVSNIQQVSRDVLSKSQMKQGATDKILSFVDSIIKRHSFETTVTEISENFMIFVIDPKENFTGVALFGRDNCFEPQLLSVNDSIDDISKHEDFDSAVIISPELHQQILNDTKIIISVYLSDALFNEEFPNPSFVSKVFDVILPEIGAFQGPLSIFFRDEAPPAGGSDLHDLDGGSSEELDLNSSRPKQCVFWYYDRQTAGFWKNDHDIKNSSNVIQCDYLHTTHFAYLILNNDRFGDKFDNLFDFLSLLTSINCAISLLGLTLIALTAAFFKQWRQNTGNKILLNFTLVIIVQIIVFYVSNRINKENKYLLCTIIGILLHYSIISQFCWMFVIAILQFRRFVTVLEGPPNFVLLKACVCGWILPLLPVCCVFGIDRNNYVKSNVGLCYPSGLGLYLGVWLPVCIIIMINFVIFSITLYNVAHRKTEYVNGSSDVLYQWRLAFLLFFILGFSWCFAFLAELDFGLVFEYLFCMTATLQGFILFLFFIVLNANTRYLYVTAISKYYKRNFR